MPSNMGGWVGRLGHVAGNTKNSKTLQTSWPLPPAYWDSVPQLMWEIRFPHISFLSQRKTTYTAVSQSCAVTKSRQFWRRAVNAQLLTVAKIWLANPITFWNIRAWTQKSTRFSANLWLVVDICGRMLNSLGVFLQALPSLSPSLPFRRYAG